MKTLLAIIIIVCGVAKAEYQLKACTDPNSDPFTATMWVTDDRNVLLRGVHTITIDPNEIFQRTSCQLAKEFPWDYNGPCSLVWQESEGQTNEAGYMEVFGVIVEEIHLAEGSGNETEVCDWNVTPHSTGYDYYLTDEAGNRLSNKKQVETYYQSGHESIPNGIYPWPTLSDEPPLGWIIVDGSPVFDLVSFAIAWLTDDPKYDINYDGIVNWIDYAILTGV